MTTKHTLKWWKNVFGGRAARYHNENDSEHWATFPTSIHKSMYWPCFVKVQKCPIYLGIYTYTNKVHSLLYLHLSYTLLFTATMLYLHIVKLYYNYTVGWAITGNFYVILTDKFCRCLTKHISLHHIILMILAYSDLILFISVHTSFTWSFPW